MTTLQERFDELVHTLKSYNLYYGPKDKRVGKNWETYPGDDVSQCLELLEDEIERRDGAKGTITINRPVEYIA